MAQLKQNFNLVYSSELITVYILETKMSYMHIHSILNVFVPIQNSVLLLVS